MYGLVTWMQQPRRKRRWLNLSSWPIDRGPEKLAQTLCKPQPKKGWKEEQAGVLLSHSTITQRQALPVRWLMAKTLLAISEVKVWGCRVNKMEQLVRNGLQPSGSGSLPHQITGSPGREFWCGARGENWSLSGWSGHRGKRQPL